LFHCLLTMLVVLALLCFFGQLQELPQPTAEAQQPPPRRPQVQPQAHNSKGKARAAAQRQQG
jgi:hypothetical protein